MTKTAGVVLVEEEDEGTVTDVDIMRSLLAEMCKYREALSQDFVAAEKAAQVREAAGELASTDSVTSEGSEAARQVIGRRKASDPHPHPQPQPHS